MTIPSTIRLQPNEPRNQGPVEGSVDYGLPTQPVNRERNTPYYVDPRQYTPINQAFDSGDINPFQYGSDRWKGRNRLNIQNYYDQLLPTSINVRNRGLQDMFQRYNTPMQNIYAGQGVGQAAGQRAQNMDQIYGSAAARGMGSSGALQGALRQNELGYLGGVGQAESAANDMEVKRKAGILSQMLSTQQADIDFYKYINAGRDVAVGRAGGTNPSGLAGFTQGAAGLGAWLASNNNSNPSTINYGNGINAADPYTSNMNSIYSNPGTGGQEDIYGTPSASAGSGGNWLSNLF